MGHVDEASDVRLSRVRVIEADMKNRIQTLGRGISWFWQTVIWLIVPT